MKTSNFYKKKVYVAPRPILHPEISEGSDSSSDSEEEFVEMWILAMTTVMIVKNWKSKVNPRRSVLAQLQAMKVIIIQVGTGFTIMRVIFLYTLEAPYKIHVLIVCLDF